MADLFGKDRRTITRHIQNIYKDEELDENSVCSFFEHTAKDGKNYIVRKTKKDFIKKYNTVMEGRDIATRIAPDADYKFYLYSDFKTRVHRLWKQNTNIDIEIIRNDLKIRDDLDINGGNFIKPLNAFEIDTTNYTIKEIFEIMKNKVLQQ